MILRAVLVGGALFGGLGAVAGLVLGWAAHPSTAWFAVLEIGVPAGYAGCLLGLGVGAVVRATHRRTAPVDDDFAGGPPGW